MIHHKIVGLGFFGKPETFFKLIKKILMRYSLCSVNTSGLEKPTDAVSTRFARVFYQVFSDIADPVRGWEALGFEPTPKKITGFYLSVKGKNLNLSVYTRTAEQHPEINHYCLSPLTELRKSRLN